MVRVSGCFLLNKTRPSPSSYQTQDRKIHLSHHCLHRQYIQYCQHYHNTYLSLHIILHYQSSIYGRVNLMQNQDQFHDLTLPAFVCTQYSVHLTLSKAAMHWHLLRIRKHCSTSALIKNLLKFSAGNVLKVIL